MLTGIISQPFYGPLMSLFCRSLTWIISVAYTSVPVCSLTFSKLHNKSPRCKLTQTILFQGVIDWIIFNTKLWLNIKSSLFNTSFSAFPSIYRCRFLFFSIQQVGPNSVQVLRNLLGKLTTNQRSILRFIACNEIFMMPAIIFMIFR